MVSYARRMTNLGVCYHCLALVKAEEGSQEGGQSRALFDAVRSMFPTNSMIICYTLYIRVV